jgi:hypothetical protein
MKKHDHDECAPVRRPAREARLHRLMFAGGSLGTSLVAGASAGPKLPPFVGE